MKTIIVLLLSCFLFASCLKKNRTDIEKHEEDGLKMCNQETAGSQQQMSSASYVFDIESFMYINEFPKTIADIKVLYPNVSFEERMSESIGEGPMGNYAYSLDSPYIKFGFWGDSIEEAILYTVDIFHTDYQCKPIQVIGMAIEELESVSGVKINRDKFIAIYNQFFEGLIIRTNDGIVQSYSIIGAL